MSDVEQGRGMAVPESGWHVSFKFKLRLEAIGHYMYVSTSSHALLHLR